VTDIFGPLGLLLLLAFSGRSEAPQRPRGGSRGAPAPKQLPAPAPWPAVVPDGLPPFPGAGWEYDEPPPAAVQQRAAQLVAPLWRQGKGANRQELTAGRWITYRAELVRSGKKGVVAYRLKDSSTLKRPPADRAAAPSSGAMTLPAILTSASAGWPQPVADGRSVQVVAGHWYQWSARFDFPDLQGDPRAIAAGIARGLASAGAVNIAVSDSPPFIVAYQLKAAQSVTVPLGVQIRFQVDGHEGSITFLEGREVPAPTGPKVPIEKPPGWVDVSTQSGTPAPGDLRVDVPGGTIYAKPEVQLSRSPLDMPDLKVGSRGEDVKLVQRKLGIKDDGDFGKGTQTAVIQFQVKNGLAPNLPIEQLRARGFGAVKQATWVKLFGEKV
jgi:hypothetical protein